VSESLVVVGQSGLSVASESPECRTGAHESPKSGAVAYVRVT